MTTKAVTDRVAKRDNYACRMCGTPYNTAQHHIRYRSRGGSDDENNLVTLCYRCHESIHNGEVRIHPMVVDNQFEIFIERLK